jgi:hypothetical protein
MIKTTLIFLIVFIAFFLGTLVLRQMTDDQIKLAKYLLALVAQCAILTITVLMTVVFLF